MSSRTPVARKSGTTAKYCQMVRLNMTVAENTGYGLRMARVPKAEAAQRVDEMLDLFSIRHIADRYPGIISGGEGGLQ